MTTHSMNKISIPLHKIYVNLLAAFSTRLSLTSCKKEHLIIRNRPAVTIKTIGKKRKNEQRFR